MARIRSIKPEVFQHDGLGELLPVHRLLFIGLWTIADRDGRLSDRPARIKVAVLPYDRVDVDALLHDLANHRERFIVRYEVAGQAYIQIPTFAQHQRPHINECASIIPPVEAGTIRLTYNQGSAEHSQNASEHNQGVHQHARKGREGKGGEWKESMIKSAAPIRSLTPGFPEFWSAYPRKRGKGAALKAWQKLTPDDALRETIMTAIEREVPSWRGLIDANEGHFVPHPATWLNQRRWEDEGETRLDPEERLRLIHSRERDKAERIAKALGQQPQEKRS